MDLDLDAVMRSLAGARTLEQLVRPLLDLLQGASGYDSVYMTHVDAARNAQRIVFARNAGALEIAEGREGRWDRSLCQRALAQGVGHVEDATVCWPDLPVARDLGACAAECLPRVGRVGVAGQARRAAKAGRLGKRRNTACGPHAANPAGRGDARRRAVLPARCVPPGTRLACALPGTAPHPGAGRGFRRAGSQASAASPPCRSHSATASRSARCAAPARNCGPTMPTHAGCCGCSRS
jgi:hypothetical protein